MNDLNEIAVFVKVVQAGSFSRAAKLLNMPNSTVSARVSALEKRLGVTLLQRTTRKLNVTTVGEAYFRRCVQGLAELNAADDEIVHAQGEPQGLLRITAPVDLGSTILPDLVCSFLKKYPKVRVELVLSDHTVDLVAEGIDVAIRAGELEDSSLRVRKLGISHFILVTSPLYLKKHKLPVHPKELIQHECIHFTVFPDHLWRLNDGKTEVKIEVRGGVAANEFNVIRRLALAGQGIALIPPYLCSGDLKSGKLLQILPEWKSQADPLSLVFPAQKFLSPKVENFMSLAKEYFREILV